MTWVVRLTGVPGADSFEARTMKRSLPATRPLTRTVVNVAPLRLLTFSLRTLADRATTRPCRTILNPPIVNLSALFAHVSANCAVLIRLGIVTRWAFDWPTLVNESLKRLDHVSLEDARRVAERVLSQPMTLTVLAPFSKHAFRQESVA